MEPPYLGRLFFYGVKGREGVSSFVEKPIFFDFDLIVAESDLIILF